MPLVCELRFPRGRYHATPWARQVNEGRPEWPPSPWRLARALVAAWHTTPGERPSEERLLDALRLLSADVVWHLPPTGRGHRRHYYPLDDKPKGRRDVTTLGMDPFVTIAPDTPCLMVFDVTPSTDQLELLRALSGNVRYLGRAESLVDIAFNGSDEWSGIDRPYREVRPDEVSGLAEDVEQVLQPTADITLAQLRVRTGDLHADKTLMPTGVRTLAVPYVSRPVAAGVPSRRPSLEDRAQPDAAVLALAGRPLPNMADAVVVAEQVRVAALRGSDRSAVLSGRRHGDREGSPACDNMHAYWLPLPDRLPRSDAELDRRRSGLHAERVAKVLVTSRAHLTPDDIGALVTVDQLVASPPLGGGDLPFPVEYARSVIGDRVVAGFVAAGRGPTVHGVARLFSTARRWRSLTPITTRRHRKRETLDEFLVAVLRRHLAHVGMPGGDETAVMIEEHRVRRWRTSRNPVKRSRTGGEQHAFHATIEFTEPVTGPVLLGALSHFGLGVFIPVGELVAPPT